MFPDFAEDVSRFGLPTVGQDFFDPFLMDASLYMPRSIETLWDHAFFLYYLNGQYRQGWRKLVSYFLTDLHFVGEEKGDEREQKELRELLIEEIDIFGSMALGGEEVGAYGNALFTHYTPFDRMLIDNRDGYPKEWNVEMFQDLGEVKYNYNEMVYEVTDLKTIGRSVAKRGRVKLPFRDRPSRDISRFKLTRLDIRELVMIPTLLWNHTHIVRRFSPDFIDKIHQGDPFFVNDVPIEQLEAVRDMKDFLYHPNHIVHLKIPTILGLKNNGWGLPETISNYRTLHHLQVLRRIDEAVGQDYVLPFRVITPKLTGEGTLPLEGHMGTYRSVMKELIRRRRHDPYAVHCLPYSVEMTEMGGGAQAKGLVQHEMIEAHTKNMFDCVGIPIELYQGAMSIQTIPTAVRLFESNWQFLYRAFNKIVKWTANAVQDMRKSARIDVKLATSTMAGDLEERGIYLQLAASGEISRARAYKSLAIDSPVDEKKRRMEEDIDIQRSQKKLEDQFAQEMQAGTLNSPPGAPGGDSGSGAGYGNPPSDASMTPLDVANQAQQKAQELLQVQDVGTRSKMLQQLRVTNPSLYANTKVQMEQARSQGASQGRKSVSQPQQ